MVFTVTREPWVASSPLPSGGWHPLHAWLDQRKRLTVSVPAAALSDPESLTDGGDNGIRSRKRYRSNSLESGELRRRQPPRRVDSSSRPQQSQQGEGSSWRSRQHHHFSYHHNYSKPSRFSDCATTAGTRLSETGSARQYGIDANSRFASSAGSKATSSLAPGYAAGFSDRPVIDGYIDKSGSTAGCGGGQIVPRLRQGFSDHPPSTEGKLRSSTPPKFNPTVPTIGTRAPIRRTFGPKSNTQSPELPIQPSYGTATFPQLDNSEKDQQKGSAQSPESDGPSILRHQQRSSQPETCNDSTGDGSEIPQPRTRTDANNWANPAVSSYTNFDYFNWIMLTQQQRVQKLMGGGEPLQSVSQQVQPTYQGTNYSGKTPVTGKTPATPLSDASPPELPAVTPSPSRTPQFPDGKRETPMPSPKRPAQDRHPESRSSHVKPSDTASLPVLFPSSLAGLKGHISSGSDCTRSLRQPVAALNPGLRPAIKVASVFGKQASAVEAVVTKGTSHRDEPASIEKLPGESGMKDSAAKVGPSKEASELSGRELPGGGHERFMGPPAIAQESMVDPADKVGSTPQETTAVSSKETGYEPRRRHHRVNMVPADDTPDWLVDMLNLATEKLREQQRQRGRVGDLDE
eukprot:Protomagalhaensia_sp_Gyna_25__5341@NODE_676_length_2854_cov_24_653996_g527_i0_p1_GENE_NODE_676_length_2854_cov_24_653996_g527_i0NODE_676_length_2854_cov_24_653996_g527_i0_p1_ORF_typecomplete_len631_score81_61_NODE_676_length_2854_cov_24_653996_g527_i0121904